MENLIIILFGAPGSGKGYLGECMKQEFFRQASIDPSEVSYISTGDLLRAEIAAETSLGKELAQIVESGKYVSDEIVDKLVAKALNGTERIKFVDGYPRTIEQLDALLELLEDKDVYTVGIKRNTPIPLILKRVSERRVCQNCKATHSVHDGKCPVCGGPSIIRKDDAVIENRLKSYQEKTAKLWDTLEETLDMCWEADGTEDAHEIAKTIVDILLA